MLHVSTKKRFKHKIVVLAQKKKSELSEDSLILDYSDSSGIFNRIVVLVTFESHNIYENRFFM